MSPRFLPFRSPRFRLSIPVVRRVAVWLFSLVVAWHAAAAPPSAAQEHRINHADTSPLPRGMGFARDYPGDDGIEAHPAVIFSCNFEHDEPLKSWDEVRDPGDRVLSFVDDSEIDSRLGHHSLRVRADLAANTGGGMTKWFESAPTLYIRFDTRFAADCDYVHHFCTLRANKGLRGRDRWSGFGGAGRRPDGDERFSTALEPWGNHRRWPPPGRWNFYSDWHEMQASGDGRYWGNSFAPDSQDDIPRDRWISCELMLRHNTPGMADGEQAFWIDGQLLGHWKQIHWRTSPTLWANAFTLESYVTDRWTHNAINIVYFDNVVIATEYIGPAVPEEEQAESRD